jgi:nicotinamidase-related amidase
MASLDLGRAALVISECQRGFVDPSLCFLGGLAQQVVERAMVPKIAELAATFRSADRPVVHCTLVHRHDWAGVAARAKIVRAARRSGVALEGDPSAQIAPELAPQAGDVVCQRQSGITLFHETGLDSILRVADIDTIVLVGVSTNLALFAAAVEAANRNYAVVVPEDCTAGASAETHEFAMVHSLPLVATVCTSGAVAEALRPMALQPTAREQRS